MRTISNLLPRVTCTELMIKGTYDFFLKQQKQKTTSLSLGKAVGPHPIPWSSTDRDQCLKWCREREGERAEEGACG